MLNDFCKRTVNYIKKLQQTRTPLTKRLAFSFLILQVLLFKPTVAILFNIRLSIVSCLFGVLKVRLLLFPEHEIVTVLASAYRYQQDVGNLRIFFRYIISYKKCKLQCSYGRRFSIKSLMFISMHLVTRQKQLGPHLSQFDREPSQWPCMLCHRSLMTCLSPPLPSLNHER